MNEILEQLGIEPGVLVVNVVGFVLLLWLFKRYLYGPIGEFMGHRTEEIEAKIKQAEENQREADARIAQLGEEVERQRQEARQQIAVMTQEAKAAIDELQREGRRQRQGMVEQGRIELERNKEAVLAEVKKTVVDLALDISEKALRESLDEERQSALLESFLRDVQENARESRLN